MVWPPLDVSTGGVPSRGCTCQHILGVDASKPQGLGVSKGVQNSSSSWKLVLVLIHLDHTCNVNKPKTIKLKEGARYFQVMGYLLEGSGNGLHRSWYITFLIFLFYSFTTASLYLKLTVRKLAGVQCSLLGTSSSSNSAISF